MGKRMDKVSGKDRSVLRALAEETARIASLPVQEERAGLWRRLNVLERVKPLVWINEIPWHELGLEDQLETSDPWCRDLEWGLRRQLYQWEHLPGDMVIENVVYCPLVIEDTGFGMAEVSETRRVTEDSVLSRRFEPQIKNEEDVLKIRMPTVTLDEEATERNFERMTAILGDIIPVKQRGAAGFWFAPWDILITWWGVQEAMTDLAMRPDLVKLAMDRLVTALLHRLDQYVELNGLALNNDNSRVGSGGYGYTSALPQDGFDPDRVRTVDQWGCATAQIFSDVSPEMHREFALDFELRWLRRFGLTYYGCCEPLDIKLEMLRQIPNLRKISMSPWINTESAASKMGRDFVFSCKPNPAILAEDRWDPDQARKMLRDTLEKTRDCVVEVILKDISTVRYEPHRLWEWAQIAREVTEEFA